MGFNLAFKGLIPTEVMVLHPGDFGELCLRGGDDAPYEWGNAVFTNTYRKTLDLWDSYLFIHGSC